MDSTSDHGELVDLPGYTVPLSVLKVAWGLEDGGCRLSVYRNGDAEPTLRVRGADGRKPELSSEMQAAIRRWKPHLMALVEWVERRSVARETT